MPPEVSKLIAAVTALVSALNESAGVTAPGMASAGVDDRVDNKKEKVASSPGLLVRFNDPQASDKTWNIIAKIFAKNFIEATKKPDYGDESTAACPAIIQQTAVVQERMQEDFFSKLIKFLLPILALVGGIGLSIAALFQGPGVLGNTLNLVGKLFATIGQNYITKIGNKLLNLGDDFIKGLANLVESGAKLLGISGGGSLGKMLGGIAAKVGGFLLKAAKFIPFIGSAVSFYFAYKRFQEGDYVGMGMEIASGILNLIPGMQWASIIIDVVNISRDFTATKEEKAAGGMGIFGKLFGGIKDWFAVNGLTILRNMPFVGSVMHFWDAYQKGFDTPEGIKSTVKALASIAGGGSVVGPAIDTLFALFEEKEQPDGTIAPGEAGGLIKMAGATRDWFIKNSKNIPFIGSLIYFWEAYQKGFTTPEGMRDTLKALGRVTGIGSIITPAVETLFALFDEEEQPERKIAAPTRSFFQAAREFIKKSLSKLPYGFRKPLEWLGIIQSAESETEESWMSQGINKSKEAGMQILEKMSEFGSGVKDWFSVGLSGARETGKQVLEKMSEFGSGVNNWFSEKMAEGKEKGQEIIANITKSGESIFNAATEMVQNIKSSVESGIEVLKNTLTTVFSEIEETTNKIIDWVKGIFNWVSEKMGKFLSKIVNIFDPQEQSGAGVEEPQINFAEDAVINIKNPALDIIADNSKKQVELLREMILKLDNLSLPSPSPAATPPSASPTTSSGGSINRGFGSSSLLSMETMGSLA